MTSSNPASPTWRIVQHVMGDGGVWWYPQVKGIDVPYGHYQYIPMLGWCGHQTEWIPLTTHSDLYCAEARFRTYDEARDLVEKSYRSWLASQVIVVRAQEIPGADMPSFEPSPFERKWRTDPLIHGAQRAR